MNEQDTTDNQNSPESIPFWTKCLKTLKFQRKPPRSFYYVISYLGVTLLIVYGLSLLFPCLINLHYIISITALLILCIPPFFFGISFISRPNIYTVILLAVYIPYYILMFGRLLANAGIATTVYNNISKGTLLTQTKHHQLTQTIHQSHSLLDGLYLSAMTITTVGYGDFVPLTRDGRIIAACEAITGYVLLALFIANLTEWAKTLKPGNQAKQPEPDNKS